MTQSIYTVTYELPSSKLAVLDFVGLISVFWHPDALDALILIFLFESRGYTS